MLDQNVPNPLAKNPNFYTHKVFAAVGLILIVSIVILAGIWYFVQSAEDKAGTVDDNTVIKTATSSTTKDETTSWKKYSNETYGFELKYPLEMSNDGQSAQGNLATLEIKDSTNSNTLGSGMFIHIYQANGDGYGTIKAAAASQAEIDKKYLVSVVDHTIGENIPAKSVNVLCENVTDILCDDVYTFVSLKDGQTLGIRAQWTAAYKDKNEKIYNQILSTFKFL